MEHDGRDIPPTHHVQFHRALRRIASAQRESATVDHVVPDRNLNRLLSPDRAPDQSVSLNQGIRTPQPGGNAWPGTLPNDDVVPHRPDARTKHNAADLVTALDDSTA